MPKLIQNALYFPERDFYLKSSYTHDYVTYEYLLGHTVSTDGGNSYLHRTIPPPEHAHLVLEYDLYDNDPVDKVRERLLWGSLPLDKSLPQVHTFRPIRLLTKDHLNAILANVPRLNPLHKSVIEWWVTQ